MQQQQYLILIIYNILLTAGWLAGWLAGGAPTMRGWRGSIIRLIISGESWTGWSISSHIRENQSPALPSNWAKQETALLSTIMQPDISTITRENSPCVHTCESAVYCVCSP